MVSFDVFDTLIRRIPKKPSNIFLLMQMNMISHRDDFAFLSNHVLLDYARLRVEAENNAYSYFNGKQIGIKHIFKSFAMMTGVDEKYVDALVELEIETEVNNSLAIQENILKVKEYIQKKERVVLISDMYLPSEMIRKILARKDEIFKDITIYVSCEYNATKGSGKLYKVVRDAENVNYSDWTHIGDNTFSDVCIPEVLGIHTQQFVMTNPYEESTFRRIGYKYGGPILVPYVQWVINMCCPKSIHHILFLARDGYVLKKIADMIIDAHGLSIKTSYVYFSREVIREEKKISAGKYVIQMIGNKDEEVAFVDTQGSGKSLEELAHVINKKLTVFYYYLLGTNVERNNNYYVFSAKRRGNIIETLCRAPHGVTVDYRETECGWEPVLEKDYFAEETEKNIDQYSEGVCDYTNEILEIEKANGFPIILKKESKCLLDQCYDCPERDIADFIGDMYHGNDNERGKLFAPRLNELIITDYYGNPESYDGVDYEYAAKRLSENEKVMESACFERMKCGLHDVISGEYLKGKTNIVLYGAGKNGWKHALKYGNEPGVNIVAWTDANAKGCKKKGYPVLDYRDAREKQFDYMVITIQSNNNEVKELLVESGISSDKVVTTEEFEKLYGRGE